MLAKYIADDCLCRAVIFRNTKEVDGQDHSVPGIEGAVLIQREVKSVFRLVSQQSTEITLCDFQNVAGNIAMSFLMNFRARFLIRPFDKTKEITLRLIQKDLQVSYTVPFLDALIRNMAFPDQVGS